MSTSINAREILSTIDTLSVDQILDLYVSLFGEENIPAGENDNEMMLNMRYQIRRRLNMMVRVHKIDEKKEELVPLHDAQNYLSVLARWQREQAQEGTTHHIVVDMPLMMAARPLHESLNFLFATPVEALQEENEKPYIDPKDHTGGSSYMFEDCLPGMKVTHHPIPQLRKEENPELFIDAVRKLLSQKDINLALVDGNSLTVIRSEWSGWLKPLELKISNSDKTSKRLKSLAHGYSITARLRHCSMEIIEGEEKTLDGILFLSRKFVSRCLNETRNKLGETKFNQMMKRVRGAKIFSTRILCAQGKFLKGHAIVVDGQDVDIRTHSCNLKKEVTESPDWLIGLEPMRGKETTRTNIQYIVNHSWLFPLESLKRWSTTETKSIFCDITTGKVSKFTEEVLSNIKEKYKDQENETIWHEEVKHLLGQFHMKGGRFQNSPFMTQETFKAFTERMLSVREGKINITIPCARHCQIISQTAAMEANLIHSDITPGTIKFLKEFGVAVVNDSDWLLMIDNHGGCDQDDFFDLIYREINGVKKVVILRCPNDIGEYTILNPADENECPTSSYYDSKNNEKEATWPALKVESFPPTMSDLLKAGYKKIQIPKSSQASGEYTKESVIEDVIRAMNNPGPGALVNAKIANNIVFQALPQDFLSMEDAIDSNVMSRSTEALDFMMKVKDKLLKNIEQESMDEFYNRIKRLGAKKTHQGTLSQIVDHVLQTREDFLKEIKKWGQLNLQIPERIQQATLQFKGGEESTMIKLLNKWRFDVMQINQNLQLALDNAPQNAEMLGMRLKKLEEQLAADANQKRNLHSQWLLSQIRPERIHKFALIVLTQATKTTKEVSDYILFNNLFRETYLNSI